VSEPATIVELFRAEVARSGARVALRYDDGTAFRARTWDEWAETSGAVAAALVELGVAPGASVAIVAGTRTSWVETDVGVLLAGAVTTAVYPTLRGEAIDYIVRDAGARVVFADDPRQLEKLAEAGTMDALDRVILFDPSAQLRVPDERGRLEVRVTDVVTREADRRKVMTYGELLALGRDKREAHAKELEARRAALSSDSLATLVYTSGTGGTPKGVELTHGNIVFEAEAVSRVFPVGTTDEQLLFLPLAHILARMTIFLQMRAGFTTAFSRDVLRAVDDCARVRPTMIVSVPRLYEKIHETAERSLLTSGELKQRVWDWAFGVGKRVAELRRDGRSPRGVLAVEHRYAQKLVFDTIARRLGGRIRFLVSGAAPLGVETAEFFHAAGLPLLEGYGLTETAGAATANLLGDHRIGTVGKPLPGVDVRIAADGEVLLRGKNVMRGYHGLAKETREAFDEGGFFHTGDVGRLDDRGFLVISDRKKDLLITAGGKKIAPHKIERALEELEMIAHAVVVADRRPFAVALVSLEEEPTRALARQRGVSGDFASLRAHPEVRALVQERIDALNQSLASYETIKRFAILDRPLGIETGELTPTHKVRRRVVEKHFADLIATLYAD
jgi:long-chain acyl-CoA synthetase